MARIRTIKPEFWTDDKILELSIPARLFFIGLWNFADDNGVLELKPKQLKARIFPGDNIDVLPLLQELEFMGLITAYSVDDHHYFAICNFRKHQVVDKPRKTVLPLPNQGIAIKINGNQLKSTDFNPGKEGKGMELGGLHPPRTPLTPPKGGVVDGKAADPPHSWVDGGDEGVTFTPPPSGGKKPRRRKRADTAVGPTGDNSPKTTVSAKEANVKAAPPGNGPGPIVGESPPICPILGDSSADGCEVLDGGNGNGAKVRCLTPNDLGRLWNEAADPVFPRVILPLSERRQRYFRPAIRAQPDPKFWQDLISRVNDTPFLKGVNDRGWRANLEFVVRRWEDILEGKYDRASPGERPEKRAKPGCPICQGDGWEYVEEDGDRWAKPCRCTTEVRVYGDSRESAKNRTAGFSGPPGSRK